MQAEQVKNWYQNLFGMKGDWQYTPIPDTEAAKKGAGMTPKKKSKNNEFNYGQYVIDRMFNLNKGNEGYPQRPEAQ